MGAVYTLPVFSPPETQLARPCAIVPDDQPLNAVSAPTGDSAASQGLEEELDERRVGFEPTPFSDRGHQRCRRRRRCVLSAVPFVASFKPSARAQALGAPVELDISKLDVGAMVRVEWRGQPVWVLRRSPDMLERLTKSVDRLSDPESNKSIQPEYAKNEYTVAATGVSRRARQLSRTWAARPSNVLT